VDGPNSRVFVNRRKEGEGKRGAERRAKEGTAVSEEKLTFGGQFAPEKRKGQAGWLAGSNGALTVKQSLIRAAAEAIRGRVPTQSALLLREWLFRIFMEASLSDVQNRHLKQTLARERKRRYLVCSHSPY